MIGFGNIKYLLYISLIAAIVLSLYIIYIIWKKRAISVLVSKTGIKSSLVQGSEKVARFRVILIILSIILFAIVMLRPQWGDQIKEVKNEGSDVLIALDVSRSMLAKDVGGSSRLQRAKDAIKWIAESLKGDRIGLILFAGDAFLQCPLTNDIGAFMMFLDSASPESIKLQGTDIGRSLIEAYRVFEKKRLTSKIFVIMTDGEDHEGASIEAVTKFKDLNVSVYSIGIGRDEGDIIPADNDSSTEDNYYKDEDGKLIRSKKNADLLKKLAGLTGGAYIDITNNLSGLSFILEIIDDQQRNIYGSRIVKERYERFQFFAVALLFLLSIELILPERRKM